MQALCHHLDSIAESGTRLDGPLPKIRSLERLVDSLQRLLHRIESDQRESLELLTSNRLVARELGRTYALLNSLSIGSLLLDNTEKIQFANEATAPFLTVAPNQAHGQSVRGVLKDAEVLALLDPGGEAAATRWGRSTELPADPESGREDTAVSLSSVSDENEEPVGQILVFQPITQIKSMEKIQTEFVDSVAHELRTPLTSIRAYVELLIDGETTDKQMQHDFYNVIYEETYRLSQLIDNLLNISMMESGTAKLDVTPTRLKRLLEESLEVVRPQCEKKNIDLVADLDDRLPTLDIDKSLFNVAVMNILSNAVKYTPESGTVIVTTSSRGEEYHIQVRDSGIGIPEEDLPRVFEKFYRSDSAKAEQGSGIGLPTALQIVRLHGGDIHATSKVGEGSEFTIVLPRTLINTSIGE